MSGDSTRAESDKVFFDRCVEIYHIKKDSLWEQSLHHRTFHEYIEKKYGMDKYKTNAIVKLGEAIVRLQLDRSCLDVVTWEHLKRIVTVAEPRDLLEWYEYAKTLKWSEFNKLYREAKLRKSGKSLTRKLVLNLTKDQEDIVHKAVDHFRRISGKPTLCQSSCLELICLSYLSDFGALDRDGFLDKLFPIIEKYLNVSIEAMETNDE